MKKQILIILCSIIFITLPIKGNAEEEKEKILSAGGGMVLFPIYFYFSYNLMLEAKIYSNFKLFGELGYTDQFYGLGGIRYYIGKSSSYFQPKLSLAFGPSSFPRNINYLTMVEGESFNEKIKYGAVMGFGFFLAFTKDRTAGLDIDYYFGLSNTDIHTKLNDQYVSFKIKILFMK